MTRKQDADLNQALLVLTILQKDNYPQIVANAIITAQNELSFVRYTMEKRGLIDRFWSADLKKAEEDGLFSRKYEFSYAVIHPADRQARLCISGPNDIPIVEIEGYTDVVQAHQDIATLQEMGYDLTRQ